VPANIEKAFDFAQEATKQVLTLSTAILTLTIAFQRDIVGTSEGAGGWLKVAWACYLLSILGGLCTLLNLSGNLERPPDGEPSIYRPAILVFSLLQLSAFFLGTVATLVFGWRAL
jgi:hypothetical protein